MLSQTTCSRSQRNLHDDELVDSVDIQGTKVDDNYIPDIADMNPSLFDANFNSTGAFWAKCETAYENWHEARYPWMGLGTLSMQKQPNTRIVAPTNNL